MSEQKEEKSISVTKFTLQSGKVILLREPKISDTEHAMKLAGQEAGPDNQPYLSSLFQREMLKLLLVQIDSQRLTLKDKMFMDSLFTLKEYGQAARCMKVVLGDDAEGNFELIPEIVTL